MIDITQKQIKRGLQEYQYYLMERTGHFTTCIFNAISCADNNNINKLAIGYPELVYAYLDCCGGLYRVPFNLIEEE